jgi:uncharacterized protein (TIGR00290 family)
LLRPRAAISWSGGKDSYAALDRTRHTHDVVAMMTMLDEDAVRSMSHGLRPEIIAAQAARLGIESLIGRCRWPTYESAFSRVLDRLAADGVTHVIFGDILFDEHRMWAERMCSRSGLTAVEPLWGCETDVLFEEWVSSQAQAVIVTARVEFFDESWLGRRLERAMAEDFARLGVDPCGERGEYHTLVTDGKLLSEPLPVRPAGRVRRSGCWALDLVLEERTPGGVPGNAAGL